MYHPLLRLIWNKNPETTTTWLFHIPASVPATLRQNSPPQCTFALWTVELCASRAEGRLGVFSHKPNAAPGKPGLSSRPENTQTHFLVNYGKNMLSQIYTLTWRCGGCGSEKRALPQPMLGQGVLAGATVLKLLSKPDLVALDLNIYSIRYFVFQGNKFLLLVAN